jgi:hypothetical protein
MASVSLFNHSVTTTIIHHEGLIMGMKKWERHEECRILDIISSPGDLAIWIDRYGTKIFIVTRVKGTVVHGLHLFRNKDGTKHAVRKMFTQSMILSSPTISVNI